MPAYNEERRIGKTLEEYSSYFESLRKTGDLDYEIIVVINNTKDKTESIVKIYSKKNQRIRFLNLLKGGKGHAVIEGFKDALKRDNNIIGFVDADLATSPEEYFKLIQSLGSNDGAVANRYHNDSKIYPPTTFRRLVVSRIFNSLIRAVLFLPYRDTQCGAKVFKREAIEAILPDLSMSQWAFDVELLYHLRRKGYKIIASPTKWIDKEYSKINFWKAGPWMALGVIRLRLLNSPFKSVIKIYDKLLYKLWKLR